MSNYERLLNLWGQGIISPRGLVEKLPGCRAGQRSAWWFVKSALNPSERLHGPIFKTKKKALEFAAGHIECTLQRLKEERLGG
jgi:hypothetical protein